MTASKNISSELPTFVRYKNQNSITGAFSNTLLKPITMGLKAMDDMLAGYDAAYDKLEKFLNHTDSLSQYAVEGVTGGARMEPIENTAMNMFRSVPELYLDQYAAQQLGHQIGVQAQMILAMTTLKGAEATQELRDNLSALHKTLQMWDDSLVDVNAHMMQLDTIETMFVNMAGQDAFGPCGAHGDEYNPIINVFNATRGVCHEIFTGLRRSQILHVMLQEQFSYYKASVQKIQNSPGFENRKTPVFSQSRTPG